jgi:heme/copper-type cytochrome/quinol oxidase subunit 2
MTIGTSLFLIAVGAILKYAVEDSVDSVDLGMVGVIFMIVGIVGLILSFFYMTMWRDRAAGGDVVRERERVRDPRL